MRWSTLWWFAAVLAAALLQENGGEAARTSRSNDMLERLIKLDEMYSAVARPSVRSGPTQVDSMGPKVQRAINMLRLQHLDRLYADRARPRFGKRIDDSNPPMEYEGQYQSEDVGDWLPVRR
ncbi:uncharacterized protein LOC107399284 isoform X1 [Tribolium castaneum]|uniref:uncharacterized protein LOC107399284 isoform X1 n=1 Tax=Tribolium castaneum TaxID=7070 RepID=UPI0030FF30AC